MLKTKTRGPDNGQKKAGVKTPFLTPAVDHRVDERNSPRRDFLDYNPIEQDVDFDCVDLNEADGDIRDDPPDSGIFGCLLDSRDRWGEIPEREEIIPGLARGEVALLVSPRNGGKTTLLRNVAVEIATGRKSTAISPLASEKYVYYLDFEDTLAGALTDFENIFGTDLATGKNRLFLSVRPKYIDWASLELDTDDREPDAFLSLSHPSHRDQIVENIKQQVEFGRDYGLLIVDTIAAGFDITDENDAAVIANTVMKPLSAIARSANVAVLASIHQSTKIGTSRSKSGHYKARGSTSFEDFARVVYHIGLNEDTEEYEIRMPKDKGVNFTPKSLTLDGRQFVVTKDIAGPPTDYVKIRDLLRTGNFSPTEISEKTGITKRTVERILTSGVNSGSFVKLKRGIYSAK